MMSLPRGINLDFIKFNQTPNEYFLLNVSVGGGEG